MQWLNLFIYISETKTLKHLITKACTPILATCCSVIARSARFDLQHICFSFKTIRSLANLMKLELIRATNICIKSFTFFTVCNFLNALWNNIQYITQKNLASNLVSHQFLHTRPIFLIHANPRFAYILFRNLCHASFLLASMQVHETMLFEIKHGIKWVEVL